MLPVAVLGTPPIGVLRNPVRDAAEESIGLWTYGELISVFLFCVLCDDLLLDVYLVYSI